MVMKVSIGDIIEIPTSIGLAYAQYTHDAKKHGGEIIRIIDGIFNIRPNNFMELVNKEHRFVTIFPLKASISCNVFSVIGHTEVPTKYQGFPLFRADGARDKNGLIDWWLWDGEKEWLVGRLTPEQYKLPIRAVPNDIALKEMIEEGWTPETDWWMTASKK